MRALVRRGLVEDGHAVTTASTGPNAVDAASADAFDVLLIDIMLPGCSGVDVVRELRNRGVRTPTLMLTALDAVNDIVSSLDAGADDYLTKPFSFAVLLARLRALSRRGPAVHDTQVQVGDLTLNAGTHVV